MNNLELGMIGNCSFGALVDRGGRVVWCCVPRFDGDPVFCSLLGGEGDPPAGFYDVQIEGFAYSEQHYLPNTPILVTTLYDNNGSAVELRDYAPRFHRFGRIFRPTMLMRHVMPVIGQPRVRVRLRPMTDYGAARATTTRGSNHIRYVGQDVVLRLTTDAPVSFVLDEVPFLLERPLTLMLGPDESLTQPIATLGREFYENTHEYWREWSRTLSIPFEWQDAVIRAAITLKMCAFEESGAIIAALTTSIPEAAGTQRNWDYRYCWLRDAYFVVHALNRLGTTKTMENYLRFIANIVASASAGHLQPLYGVTLEAKLTERIVDTLPGYRGMGPVRVGNQAYEHYQNDIYGSVILAVTQVFFDQRLVHGGGTQLFERLKGVGRQALAVWDQPDAGLWELRTQAHVHTFSSVMCWAAADRLARIATRLTRLDDAEEWRKHADHMRDVILQRAWDPQQKSFVAQFDGTDMDASLLLLHELGFVDATDPRFVGTVDCVGRALKRGKHLFRYLNDDFGTPHTAFTICTFWYISALAGIGRRDEARALFENLLASRNHLGLLSEDIDPKTGELWGNFPQTYSMVGLINCAMRLSDPWEEAF